MIFEKFSNKGTHIGMKMAKNSSKSGFSKQDPPKNSVAIYVRVSTEEQAREGISVEAQKDRLIAFAKAKDLVVTKIYADEGFSAGSMKRPMFQEMLSDAHKGCFANVLVYKIDRFSRNLKDLITLLDEFKSLGINFISATEPIDTTSAVGNAFMQIIGVFAELERGMVAERVSLAFGKKIDSREYFARPPLGYKFVDKKLVIDEKEAKKVRDIFESRAKGENYVSICLRHNIPVSTFYHIIKNPVYIGFISYKGELIKGDFEPIIDNELFVMANSKNRNMINVIKDN